MRILKVDPVDVQLASLETPSGVFGPTSLTVTPWNLTKTTEVIEATEAGDLAKLKELVPVEELARRITGWEGDAFRDDNGDVAPCTPENVALVADVPGMYFKLVLAVIRGHFEAARKNSSTSPAGDTAAERGSAEAAGPTS